MVTIPRAISPRRSFLRSATAFAATAALLAGTAVAASADEYPSGGTFDEKNAYIEQNIATYDDLLALLQSDSDLTTTITDWVSGLVTPELIKSVITPLVNTAVSSSDAIIELATPLIKDAVAALLGEYGLDDPAITDLLDGLIDQALGSDIIDTVLSNDFTQDVLSRTIAYVIEDLTQALDVGQIMDALLADGWEAAADTIFKTGPTDVLGAPIKEPLGLSADAIRLALENPLLPVNPTYYELNPLRGPSSYTYRLWANTTYSPLGHEFTFDGESFTFKTGARTCITLPYWGEQCTGTDTWQTYTANLNPSGQLCLSPTSGLLIYPGCVAGAETPGPVVGYEVSGWNATVVQGSGVVQAAKALAENGTLDPAAVITDLLADVDLAQIVFDATWRAVQDEVVERVTAKIIEIKTDLYQQITDGLAEYGVTVVLDPVNDTLQDVADKVLAAVDQAAGQWIEERFAARPVTAPVLSTNTPTVNRWVSITPGIWDPIRTDFTNITYEWRVEGSDEVVGTGLRFQIPESAVGQQLSVTVTAPSWIPSTTLPGVNLTWTQTYNTAAVQPAELKVVAPLSLDNTEPVIEETITVNGGEFDQPTTLSYQWYANGEEIAGATGVSYEVAPEYAGTVISVKVTATPAGTNPAAYLPYEETLATSMVKFKQTEIDVAGSYSTTSPTVGQTISVTPPRYNTGVGATYQWYLDGVLLDGVTGATIDLPADYVGEPLQVVVTSADKPGWLPALSVLPAPVVQPGTLTLATPEFSAAHLAMVGDQVTASAAASDSATVTYEWFNDNAGADPVDSGQVSGDGAVFTPVAADLANTVWVKATATKTGYTTAVSWAETPAVKTNLVNLTATITGDPVVGSALTANVSATPDVALTYSYAWKADGDPVGGDTATYTLTAGDLDKDITVAVTATPSDAAYTVPSVTSAAVTVGLGSLTVSAPVVTGGLVVAGSVTAVATASLPGAALSYA
ncbi:MAG: hypothetical protein LBJ62_08510, partial [Bifidobacteriaceae bacterium]|nr:hypothetical protein [Bifidobacteriaceae bacterium]